MWVGVVCTLTLHGVADERGEIIARTIYSIPQKQAYALKYLINVKRSSNMMYENATCILGFGKK